MRLAFFLIAALPTCSAPECPPLSSPWKGFEKASGFDVETCAMDNTFAKHGNYVAYFHGTKHKAMAGTYKEDVRVGRWDSWKKNGTYDIMVCYDDKGVELWRDPDPVRGKTRTCPGG